MTELLTIGEPLVLFASEELDRSIAEASHFCKYLAGAEVNVAIGVRRLGHSVEYIAQIGQDPLGEFVLQALQKNHVATKHITGINDYWTGIEFKSRTSVGDPETFYLRKNSAASHLSANRLDQLDLTQYAMVHITGIFPALSDETFKLTQALMQAANRMAIPVVFDPNLRPALWANPTIMKKRLNQLAKMATIVLPGQSEGALLTGKSSPEAIASYYLTTGLNTKMVAVKTGQAGAYVQTQSGCAQYVSGFPVATVIDTVGAGDGFALGVITGLLEHLSPIDAVRRGNAIGAMAVQSLGDNEGYPTQEQLEDFLTAHA